MENEDCDANWKINLLKNQKMDPNFLLNDIKVQNIKKVFF